jgi:chaperonin GroEL (HSP60 family)
MRHRAQLQQPAYKDARMGSSGLSSGGWIDDQKTGVEIVRKALSWPARQIAINAGEDGSIVAQNLSQHRQDQNIHGRCFCNQR